MPASPGDDECIVKVLYSGVNPADTKHTALGVYDTVSGYDFCGEVIEAGPHCNFAVGDVIAGANPTGVNRPADFGSHQNYLRCVPDAKARNVATIFAVALPEQFSMLQNMGVTRCFNFMDSDAVDQIRASARELGQPILNVLDAVGSTNARTADSAAACADDNATIVTLTVHPKYSMPLCTMYRDTQLDIDGIGPVFIPKREANGERAAKAFDWAVEHYGNGFEFPRITLNSGYLPLSKEVTSGISGSVDFGKNVIVHPIRDIER